MLLIFLSLSGFVNSIASVPKYSFTSSEKVLFKRPFSKAPDTDVAELPTILGMRTSSILYLTHCKYLIIN